MNAEIIERLENSFAEGRKIEEFFGGVLAGALGMVEAKTGSRWTDPGNVRARGEIAQAIADLLARKVPGLHSVQIATLGEDGRHIGGGSIGYASDEIAKGGLLEILKWAYANSPQSTKRGLGSLLRDDELMLVDPTLDRSSGDVAGSADIEDGGDGGGFRPRRRGAGGDGGGVRRLAAEERRSSGDGGGVADIEADDGGDGGGGVRRPRAEERRSSGDGGG